MRSREVKSSVQSCTTHWTQVGSAAHDQPNRLARTALCFPEMSHCHDCLREAPWFAGLTPVLWAGPGGWEYQDVELGCWASWKVSHLTSGPLWSSEGKPMTRCRFLLDPTTSEACRHLEWWRKLSYHILTFQPFTHFPSQTGNVYLNTAVSSLFWSQVKNQRCPLLPHSPVQAITSPRVRSGPLSAFRQDGEEGPHMSVHFHPYPLFPGWDCGWRRITSVGSFCTQKGKCNICLLCTPW